MRNEENENSHSSHCIVSRAVRVTSSLRNFYWRVIFAATTLRVKDYMLKMNLQKPWRGDDKKMKANSHRMILL